MTHILVVHCRQPHDIYIGRPRASEDQVKHFGNPFSHIDNSRALVWVKSRHEAVVAFEDWLDGTAWTNVAPEQRLWVLAHLAQLRGKRLGCWCAPAECHGEVLVARANG